LLDAFSSRATSSRSVSTLRQKLPTSAGRASRAVPRSSIGEAFGEAQCGVALPRRDGLAAEARRRATTSPNTLERSSSKSR